jgi:hypothetical protein
MLRSIPARSMEDLLMKGRKAKWLLVTFSVNLCYCQLLLISASWLAGSLLREQRSVSYPVSRIQALALMGSHQSHVATWFVD